jgi:hypothetical protein
MPTRTLVTVVLIILLSSACVVTSGKPRDAAPDDIFTLWPDLAGLRSAKWQHLNGLPVSIGRGDALLVGRQSEVTVRSSGRPLLRLATSVRNKPDGRDHLYYIDGPAFARFEDSYGVGFSDDGLAVERVTGIATLIHNSDTVRQFSVTRGFFRSESSTVADRSRRIDGLLDGLPWQPAGDGTTVKAWGAIRIGAESSAVVRFIFADGPSIAEDIGVPVEQGSSTYSIGALTTMLLTPHDALQATVVECHGDVFVVENAEAVLMFYQQTGTVVRKRHAP